MKQPAILALVIVFLSVLIVSGTNICDNTPCEPQINASIGKEFNMSLESNASNGFEWWMKFDHKNLTLLNSTFISGNKKLIYSFKGKSLGNTEVIMLLLKPCVNCTIAERKIFPIEIMPQAPTPRIPEMHQYQAKLLKKLPPI